MVTTENHTPSSADERRWRKALQKLGMAAVRRQLQQPVDDVAGDAMRSGTDTGLPHPPRPFIDAWYREAQRKTQRAKNSRAYLLSMLALAVVAGVILFLIVRR